jgi:ribosomal protein S18 acetylase RimI-like enzyme
MNNDAAPLRLRTGTYDDVPDVLMLWREADTAPSTTDDADGLNLLLSAAPSALLIAEYQGQIVGTLVASFDGWRGNLYRLAVQPAHRHRGVARSLVIEGEHRLRSAGARRITALVAHELDGAEGFWTAAGYGPDSHTTRFVKTFPHTRTSTSRCVDRRRSPHA